MDNKLLPTIPISLGIVRAYLGQGYPRAGSFSKQASTLFRLSSLQTIQTRR